MKPKILLMNKFLEPCIELMKDEVDVIKYWEIEKKLSFISANAIVGMISSAWDTIDESLIKAFPNLKIISHAASGLDVIDLKAAQLNNVIVTNAPGVVTIDTADLALGMLLCLSRKILQNDRYVRNKLWGARPEILGSTLASKKIGIVGLGNIGLEIAKKAAVFGMQVYYWDKAQKQQPNYYYVANLAALAACVDFLIIACAGNHSTKNLINHKVFGCMNKTAFLINISRGFVVNQQDLIDALQQGNIAGAGLDVFKDEPDVPKELLKMDNVILQPHAGTATVETRGELYKLAVNNILQYFSIQTKN